jgi:hypothetical protein
MDLQLTCRKRFVVIAASPLRSIYGEFRAVDETGAIGRQKDNGFSRFPLSNVFRGLKHSSPFQGDLCKSRRDVSVGAVIDRVNQLESSNIPLLEKEGWLRHKSNIAKPPNCRRRGGQFPESVQA